MQNNKRTVLITGASHGIGRALADTFAEHDYNIILLADHEPTLITAADEIKQQYPEVVTQVIVQDLAQPDAAENIAQQLDGGSTANNITVDVLINNAAVGQKGFFTEQTSQLTENTIAVNITSLTKLTHLILPTMLAKKSGHILNVSSVAAYQPGPLMAVYFASKAYILSFSEALSNEVAGTGVSVTALCPGPTLTSFAERSGLKSNPIHNGIVPMLTAKQVADKAYIALMRGKRVVIPGWSNVVCTILSKLAPTSAVMNAIRKLHEK